MDNITVKFVYSYYPYREKEVRWECAVTYNDSIYIDPKSPTTSPTKDEAQGKALDIFKKAYYQSSTDIKTLSL